MEFLRSVLAKIELIGQQPAMSNPIGVKWALSPAVACWIGWLGGWRCVPAMQSCSDAENTATEHFVPSWLYVPDRNDVEYIVWSAHIKPDNEITLKDIINNSQ